MAAPANKTLVDFCLPVYNEERILEDSVLKLFNWLQQNDQPYDWRITIISNGSTDNSFALGQKLSDRFPSLISIVNIPQPGRGQALKKYWQESPADILVYMDIDLAVDLKNIPALISPLQEKNYELAIGSRLLPESHIDRSFIRELSSQTYNFLSRLILGHRFSDMQCGFKAVAAPSFKKIATFIQDPHWFFDTELIVLIKKSGGRVKEVPVDWQENRYDKRQSKVKLFRDSWKFFKNLVRFRWRLSRLKGLK